MKKIIITLISLISLFTAYANNPGEGIPAQSTLTFRENKGQITDQYKNVRNDIDFKLALKGLSVFAGNAQLHYQFYQPDAQSKASGRSARMAAQRDTRLPVSSMLSTYRMDVELVGANVNAPFTAEEQVPDAETYYGRTTMQVNGFKKITYKNIYPSIDWVIYIKNNQMKYDFVVHPRGKVADIRLRYKGAVSMDLEKGSIIAKTPMGVITEHAPYSYLKGTNKETASRFITADGIVRFEVGEFQPDQTLVIDPELSWSTYYGGEGGETENYSNNFSDNQGNIYITGGTGSSGNIATTGSFQQDGLNLGVNAFLAKFNPAGVRQWATYYGTLSEQATSAVCDKDNNVYIAGMAVGHSGLSDITTPGSHQETGKGHTDAFLVKFNSQGIRQWATFYGGNGDLDEGYNARLAFDSVYNKLYLAGSSNSTEDIATPGSFQPELSGAPTVLNQDAFIAQFNTDGVRQWGTYFGGLEGLTIGDQLSAAVCDSKGDLYILVNTYSLDVLSTPGSHQPARTGSGESMILAKFKTDGSREWSTYYGKGETYGNAVTMDSKDNVYITGETYALDGIATPGSYQPTRIDDGNRNSFLAKFNSSGERQWGTYFGGATATVGFAIASDSLDNVYITGFADQLLTGTPGIYQSSSNGGFYSGFIARFTSTGKYKWTTLFGGEDLDYITAATVVKSQHALYVSGIAYSGTHIATAGAHQTLNGGSPDALLAKFLLDPVIAQPNISGIASLCEEKTAVYTVVPVANANSYTWKLPVGWTGNSTSASITVKAGATGGSISVTANGTYDTSEVQVKLVNSAPLPSASIAASGAKLTALPAGMTSYQWLQNEQPIPGATRDILTASGNGLYKVIVTNSTGCTDTSAVFELLLNTNLYVPNVFTPNGDTKNDVLQVYGNGLQSIDLLIFNQWGQKIFETHDIKGSWDGKVGGKIQPTGVYIYTLKAISVTGEVINRKGSINLIR